MANNFQVNCYQINGLVLPRDAPIKYGFPTAGVLIQDVSGSPNRSLSSGYNVYGLIIFGSSDLPLGPRYFYVAETIAQLATIIS